MYNLLANNGFLIASAPVATGTTPIVSSILDIAGCHAVAFILHLGAASPDNVIIVEESDDATLATGKNTIGTTVASLTINTTDDRLVLVSCIQPTKRYVRLTMTRTTASVLNSMIAVTKPKKLPVVQNTAHVQSQVTLIEGN